MNNICSKQERVCGFLPWAPWQGLKWTDAENKAVVKSGFVYLGLLAQLFWLNGRSCYSVNLPWAAHSLSQQFRTSERAVVPTPAEVSQLSAVALLVSKRSLQLGCPTVRIWPCIPGSLVGITHWVHRSGNMCGSSLVRNVAWVAKPESCVTGDDVLSPSHWSLFIH